jgi:hypothetical protein
MKPNDRFVSVILFFKPIIKVGRPKTNRILAILDPTTLPIARPGDPLNVAFIATISSGADVPKATTVSDTSKAETPNLLLSWIAPLTRKSPEINKRNRPKKERAQNIKKFHV